MRSRKLFSLRCAAAALLGMLLTLPAVALACPSCKDAIDGDPVATALSATTLVLIAIPALLVGSIGGWVSYVYWRAARRTVASSGAAAQPSSIAWHPAPTERGNET